MARIRSIKPAFFKSTSVRNLSKPARLTWVGLWTYLDDFGYGRDDARLVKAEIWPLDDDYTARHVEKDLEAIAAEGMICRYEADGRKYMHAPAWIKHQKVNRPRKSEIPPCPAHANAVKSPGLFTECAVNGHGKNSAGIGNREEGIGKREIGNASQSSSEPYTDPPCGKPDDDDDQNPDPLRARAERLAKLDLEARLAAQAKNLDLEPVADLDKWLARAAERRHRELLANP